ncbi:hypothetical protein CYMTET_31023 [Cymbomonas tetramitiformis]|uniref:ABC transporter domain-containing protein n=1 Tax=Cymbomonas tetramitiformis TaxID=36881 RepID=A0AAE0FI76_9CHLO|nr:hypothetical protein CYMTET_31023 [Cymbomonas tetramitiformis]
MVPMRTFVVAFLFSALAMQGRGEECCSCPTFETCEWSGFTCGNDGYFSHCNHQVPCEMCRASSCSSTTWNLTENYYCTCPEGTAGPDCEAVTEESFCSGGTLNRRFIDYDSPMHMTCNAIKYPEIEWLGLRLHSIFVDTTQMSSTTEDGSINFVVKHRPLNETHNRNYDWQADEYPDTWVTPIQSCDSAITIIDCTLSMCSVAYFPDAEDYPVQYTCETGTCEACNRNQDPLCPVALSFLVPSGNGREFKLLLREWSTDGGVANGMFLSTIAGLSELRIGCLTGRCIEGNATSVTPSAEEEGSEGEKLLMCSVLVALTIICVAAVAILAALMYLSRVAPQDSEMKVEMQPQGPPRLCLHEDALESSDQTVLSETNDRNVLPVSLVFRNVSYAVEPAAKAMGQRTPMEQRLQLLDGVSGTALSGQMTAVMGPSGAGKSTLLGVITGRLPAANCSKDSLVTLACPTASVQREDVAAYVPQHDCLLATDTVLETLHFAAALCENAGGCFQVRSSREATVTQVLAKLKLDHRGAALVGHMDAGGLSGGERKRVAIGLALMTRPSILVLDEPTSGLDSHNAAVVVKCLEQLAFQTEMAVLTTIHQPTTQIFNRFSEVLLMVPGGRCAYFGPPTKIADFITGACPSLPREEGVGVCEYMLEATSIPGHAEELVAAFGTSQYSDALMGAVTAAEEINPKGANTFVAERAGLSRQMLGLFARQWRRISRDPSLLGLHLLVAVAISVILGVVYFDLDNRLSGIQNRAGFFFMLTVYVSFTAMSALSAFIAERRLLWREVAAHLYMSPTLFISTQACDLMLLRVLPAMIISAITYPMVGLHDTDKHVMMFTFVMVLTACTATTICFLYSIMFADIAKANLCAVMTFAFAMMFGGLLTNSDTESSTSGVMDLKYISFIYYSWEALMINEFKDIDVIFDPDGFGEIGLTGQVFLDTYGIDSGDLDRDWIVLLCFFIGLSGISMMMLAWITRLPP